MSRSRRFQWGTPYLLTDLKEGVFVNEPAVCVGKHDAEKRFPRMCAICGEPLGSEGYDAFFLNGPTGRGIDIVIGKGCIRDRISEKEIRVEQDYSPRITLDRALAEFPDSGRWYGTFLHHCIAKPYARNKNIADKWDGSVLKLPGVRYIMGVIDSLRDGEWTLDAEMILDCGRVDLLATHPEKGTAVFDWKSDQSFETKTEYFRQVNRYMAKLYKEGFRDISGYILWIRDERREYVPFQDVPEINTKVPARIYAPSPRMKCTLNIDMDGGEGIERKRITEYSHHRTYGDEVFFYIRPCELYKHGFEFANFEASPYREGEHSQWFDAEDAEEGLHLRFICGKKRQSFSLKANWKLIRPFKCTLALWRGNKDSYGRFGQLEALSKTDKEGKDYVEFEVSDIRRTLDVSELSHALLIGGERMEGMKTEWEADDLQNGMTIRLPCTMGDSHYGILFDKFVKNRKEVIEKPKPVPEPAEPTCDSDSWEAFYRKRQENGYTPVPEVKGIEQEEPAPQPLDGLLKFDPLNQKYDPAEHQFTPGRIYASGGRYYGIYKRKGPEKYHTAGKVDVAEVDVHGRKISDLEWRHIYMTQTGKEYIYGLSNREWKIYTKDVLEDLAPEGMDIFGDHNDD